jgi:hypothetical protein
LPDGLKYYQLINFPLNTVLENNMEMLMPCQGVQTPEIVSANLKTQISHCDVALA